jgi:serine/threonine protein kinase
VDSLRISVNDAYDIGRSLGFGGFANVRQGRHKASQSDVCVKVIDKERAGKSYKSGIVDAGGCEMALAISKEPHKNVVRYLDIFESTTHYYAVMERLDGCELTVALTETGAKWSEMSSAGVMSDLLSALSHLHEVVGVCHRDVKLENLMFRGRTSGPFAGRKIGGGLVLIDFGLSRFIGQEHDGRLAGTELYRAPEVVRGEHGEHSVAVDLWAAGIVLFVLLTGDMPFEVEDVAQGQTAEEVENAVAILESTMALEGRTNPHALLKGLLQPDPSTRWDATRALQDGWFECAPDKPGGKDFTGVLKASRASTCTAHTIDEDLFETAREF